MAAISLSGQTWPEKGTPSSLERRTGPPLLVEKIVSENRFLRVRTASELA